MYSPSKQKPFIKDPFNNMLVLCSGTIFHLTSGLDNQNSDSSKLSKPVCLARTPEFQNLLSRLPHTLQLEQTLISVNPAPFPYLCHFQSLLLADVLFIGTSTCFAVITVVVLELLWSASNPTEHSRNLLDHYYCKQLLETSHSDSGNNFLLIQIWPGTDLSRQVH